MGWTKLADNEVTSSGVSEIEFASISQSYAHLLVVGLLQCTGRSSTQYQYDVGRITFNDDGSGNYGYSYVHQPTAQGFNTTGGSDYQTYIKCHWQYEQPDNCTSASAFYPFTMWILGYSKTGTNMSKPVYIESGSTSKEHASSSQYGGIYNVSGLYYGNPSGVAISSIQLSPVTANFGVNSYVSLYGLDG